MAITHEEDSGWTRSGSYKCKCGADVDIDDGPHCIHVRDGFPVEDRWHEFKCRPVKNGSRDVQHFYQVERAVHNHDVPTVHATPVPMREESRGPNVNVIVVREHGDGGAERLAKAVEGMTEAVRSLPAEIAKHVAKHIAKKAERKKPKVQRQGWGLKGPKTPFMQKQLKEFQRYMDSRGYTYVAERNRTRANACWKSKSHPDKSRPGRTVNEWDEAAKVKDKNRRGYSCYKTLADAYGRLTPGQRRAL